MARKQRAEVATAAETGATAPATEDRRLRKQVGHQLRPAASASEPQAIGISSHNVRFDLTVDVAYHAIRELYFSRLSRMLTGIQVFLGTGAVAAMTATYPRLAIALVAVSALCGVMLLVLDPAGAARDHRALRSKLQMILAEMEANDCTNKSLRTARANKIKVAADAPPGYRGAQALAYNNAVNATYPAELARLHRYKIGFWRGLFANIFPMRGHQFGKEVPTAPNAQDAASSGES